MTDIGTMDGRVARGVERRQTIANAVIAVVAQHGLRGLTHRRVAEAAGVPLGSTTYHFETLDDLMVAGLELAADRNLALMQRSARNLRTNADVVAWLTDLTIEMVTTWRESIVAEHELYLEAIRTPALRPVATRWDDALVDLLTPRVDSADAARIVVWTIDGLAVSLVMTDTTLDRDQILGQMARLFDGLAST